MTIEQTIRANELRQGDQVQHYDGNFVSVTNVQKSSCNDVVVYYVDKRGDAGNFCKSGESFVKAKTKRITNAISVFDDLIRLPTEDEQCRVKLLEAIDELETWRAREGTAIVSQIVSSIKHQYANAYNYMLNKKR